MTQQNQAPAKTISVGSISMGIWKNDAERNGRKFLSYSCRLKKRYFDEQTQQWKDSDYLFGFAELAQARQVIEEAMRYVAFNDGEDVAEQGGTAQ